MFVGNVNAYGSFSRVCTEYNVCGFHSLRVSEYCQVKRYLIGNSKSVFIPKKFAKGVLLFLISFYEDETFEHKAKALIRLCTY